MKTRSGEAYVDEDASIAYCAQTAWILAASIKSNITIGSRKDNLDLDMYTTAGMSKNYEHY